MNKKYRQIVIGIIIILFTGIISSWSLISYLKKTGHQLSFSCSGHFKQKEANTSYLMDVAYYIEFAPEGTAMIAMSGYVNEGDKNFIVSRITTFDYKLISNDIYRVTSVDVRPSRRESLPQNIFEKYFYSTNDKGNFITINKVKNINNAWLIGSSMSPAFMCIEK